MSVYFRSNLFWRYWISLIDLNQKVDFIILSKFFFFFLTWTQMYYACGRSVACGINVSIRYIKGESLDFIENFGFFFFLF